MFKRKIMEELIKWKNDTGKKKALVIKGMRPVFCTKSRLINSYFNMFFKKEILAILLFNPCMMNNN